LSINLNINMVSNWAFCWFLSLSTTYMISYSGVVFIYKCCTLNCWFLSYNFQFPLYKRRSENKFVFSISKLKFEDIIYGFVYIPSSWNKLRCTNKRTLSVVVGLSIKQRFLNYAWLTLFGILHVRLKCIPYIMLFLKRYVYFEDE